MIQFDKVFLTVFAGLALGFALTFVSVDRGFGFGAVQAGPWVGSPKSGSRDSDPYTRAALARSGETPLGSAEGLSFLARNDSQGAPLDPRCEYAVRGPAPSARWWTLTLMSAEGRLPDTATGVHGFTSSEIIRDANGGFEITLAQRARPGNWLPIANSKPFVLAFRLYDTTVSATSSALDAAAMPQINRKRCE